MTVVGGSGSRVLGKDRLCVAELTGAVHRALRGVIFVIKAIAVAPMNNLDLRNHSTL